MLTNLAHGVALALMISLTGSPEGLGAGQPQVNPKASALSEFQKRVSEYVELHNKVESGLPPEQTSNDPAAPLARQRLFADLLRKARAGARPGDIFVEPVRPIIRGLVRQDVSSRSSSELRAALTEVPRTLRLKINAEYPLWLPLATVPPELLLHLPQLPEELEYRFIGRALVLRDTHANLIVDYLEKALPAA